MANLAYKSLKIWDELERDAGDNNLRLMTGLLNFGDPDYGKGGPEGIGTLSISIAIAHYPRNPNGPDQESGQTGYGVHNL